jgi:hypothetical protein
VRSASTATRLATSVGSARTHRLVVRIVLLSNSKRGRRCCARVPGLDLGPDRDQVSVSTRLAPGGTGTTKAWPSVEWSSAATAFEPIGSERRASRPRRRSQTKEGSSKSRDPLGHRSRTKSGDACKTCGGRGKNGHHPRSYCPANEATCHRCGKEGHYEAVCLSTKHKDDTKVWKFHDRMAPRAQEHGGFHDFMADLLGLRKSENLVTIVRIEPPTPSGDLTRGRPGAPFMAPREDGTMLQRLQNWKEALGQRER